MSNAPLYDDGSTLLDEGGVTLRRYCLPFGGSKRTSYAKIRGVELRPMGWLTGRGRLWGSALAARCWLPLDGGRFRKRTLVVLDLGGRGLRPGFTPDDPDTVVRLLRERIRG